jgi:DNA-binding XRE family transcriptional regulator
VETPAASLGGNNMKRVKKRRELERDARPLNLMHWRIRRGFSLRGLAESTGISPATLMRIERGMLPASMKSRILLKDGLGISDRELNRLLAS